MLALIQKSLHDGRSLGFPLTRMIAHAETTLQARKSGNDWVEYEMRLNEVLPNYDDPAICTFDVNPLNSNLAIDILRMHPIAVIGGVLVEDNFFTTPKYFLREVRELTAPHRPYHG